MRQWRVSNEPAAAETDPAAPLRRAVKHVSDAGLRVRRVTRGGLGNELGLAWLADEVPFAFAQNNPVALRIETHHASLISNFLGARGDCARHLNF